MKHRIAEFPGTDRFDLVVLNRAPVELKYNVVATGKVLYEESRAALVEFEAETLSAYFDSLPPPLAGFLNILVHEYIDIDWNEVYKNLQGLSDLETFADHVKNG